MSSEVLPRDTQLCSWLGRMQGTGSALHIWLGNTHVRSMATLVLAGGEIRRQVSGGASPTYEQIGSYVEGGDHTVVLIVDQAASTYSILIGQGAGQTVTAGPHPVEDTLALGTTKPTLYLWFADDTSGSASYTIDEVTISHKPPAP